MSTNSNGLTRLRLSQTARPVDVILYWHREKSMELNAPYQRGDVWSETRQRNLIRSILLGIPIPSIIINDRASAGWDELVFCAVIDGKQRLTAILKFMLDELTVPGEWFGVESAVSHGMIVFSDLPINRQRGFRNHPIPFTEGQLGSLDEEREVFDLVNFGGVPQGQTDLEPVIEKRHSGLSLVQKLAAKGVYKGFHGLEGLLERQDFWDKQPYETRLYYGDGIADYLHRSVLGAAVKILQE